MKFNGYDEFLSEFSIDCPDRFNFVFDVVDTKAARTPHTLAMIHVDRDGARREFDYQFFASQSAQLANSLIARGVKKGDRVMLLLYRRVEFWVSMLALHRLGAVAIPSPFLLTAKDIAYRVDEAEITAVICEDSLTATVQAAREKCPAIQLLVQVGGAEAPAGWLDYTALIEAGEKMFSRPADAPGGSDPLLIFFSSGTTGNPKMVAHDHRYPAGHQVTASWWHDLKPGDIHLTLADTGWGKAVWGKFYGQWMAGATVFVWDFRGKFEPEQLLDILEKHRVTTFCAPPTVYRFLINEDLGARDLSALRHCTTAGELLNDSVFHEWKQATGLAIYEGYGQTETTLQIATFPFMEPKPGSIGKPVPGWPVVLLDEGDRICPPGVEGEICIDIRNARPIGLFSGYLNQPHKTAEATRSGYYRTGDKAWVDEEGYFWFMGRVDDLIKSSGYRVGPFEVESALVSHDAVLEAAVTGVPDPVRGQAIKATVVLNDGFEPGDKLTRELQDHVKQVTAPYKYPRIINYVEELPKTISGKIKRQAIRSRDMVNTSN